MSCQNSFSIFSFVTVFTGFFDDNLQYHVITLHILVAFISSPYDWKIIFPRKESRECIFVCGVRSEVKVNGFSASWLRSYRLLLLG